MKRWHDLILEADFPWNIDEKYCEQAEWMMLLGSVLAFADHALKARSNTPPKHGTDPKSGSPSTNSALGMHQSCRIGLIHVPCTADAIFPCNVIPAKKTLRNASNASDRQPSGMVLHYAVYFFGVECFLCRAGRR